MTSTATNIAAELDRLTCQASSLIKLEITGGVHTWQLLPSLRHQKLIDRIRASIAPLAQGGAGGGFHLSDPRLLFPDGSFKRPNIAIFCAEPPGIDEAREQVPEAVIEIVSPGYEKRPQHQSALVPLYGRARCVRRRAAPGRDSSFPHPPANLPVPADLRVGGRPTLPAAPPAAQSR